MADFLFSHEEGEAHQKGRGKPLGAQVCLQTEGEALAERRVLFTTQ